MATPVTPVLSLVTDQLTEPRDMLAYLIRHAFNNPGWTSSEFESRLISMRKLFAEHNYNIKIFVEMLTDKLQFSVNNLFDNKYRVVIGTEPDEENLSTKITISIVDEQGRLILTSSDISVKDNNIVLNRLENPIQ